MVTVGAPDRINIKWDRLISSEELCSGLPLVAACTTDGLAALRHCVVCTHMLVYNEH
jgi:hypothetical protein